NDLLVFMASDAGERAKPGQFPGHKPTAEVRIYDPIAATTRWAYLLWYPSGAPRSPVSYVQYDPSADRVTGTRVSLGFNRGLPNYLAIRDRSTSEDTNLLDRLKVRASATFLWGLLRFSRNEDDLTTQFVGWHQGPIRVIRSQRQWIRLGWGIHSPTFGS